MMKKTELVKKESNETKKSIKDENLQKTIDNKVQK